jgi:hypothetical protein
MQASKTRPGRGPVAALLARSLVLALRTSIVLLVAFHGLIFWKHLASGALADPARAFGWAVGVALFAAMIALRRAGVPLLWGRRALVVWLMVTLLHVGAFKAGQPAATALDAAADVALTLFTVPSPVVTIALLASLLLALASLRSRPRGTRPLGAAFLRRRNHDDRLTHRCQRSPLPSRAPPLAAC